MFFKESDEDQEDLQPPQQSPPRQLPHEGSSGRSPWATRRIIKPTVISSPFSNATARRTQKQQQRGEKHGRSHGSC